MIKVIVHSYYSEDTRVRKQCEALVRSGYKVQVICLNRGQELIKDVIGGVQVRRANVSRATGKRTKLKYILEYLSFFLRVLFRLGLSKDELVIVHNMPNFLVFSAIIKKLRGVPVLIDVHDLMPEIWSMMEDGKRSTLTKILLAEEFVSHWFADYHLTVNKSVAKYLQKRNNHSYNIIHNGPLYSSNKQRTYQEYLDLRFNFVFHGNIHERYGLQRLVKLMPEIKSKYPKVKLDIHGYGPYKDRIVQLIHELGIENYCKVHGRFSPEELSGILNDKGLGFVVADKSIQHDLAIPVKLTEYIDNGVASICTQLDTSVDYFKGGVTFFDVNEEHDLKEKIINCLENSSSTYDFTIAAKQRLHEISWQGEEEKYIKFITEVVA